ncbi:MAG: deoxyribonuclease IV [Sulfobacillus sp.]
MRIGCHLSVAKGFQKTVMAAPELGATCFQYFTKNPRGFRGAKALDLNDAARGKALMEELDLVAIGHTPYLINLASPEDELFNLSVDALVQDLVIAQARNTYGVVVHCGKHKGQGVDFGIERMHQALALVLEKNTTEGVMVLIENTAGQGSEVGFTLEQLLAIVEPFSSDQIGFCFDTQHAYAAGILSPEDPREFPGFSSPEFMKRLRAIHFNDSKVPFNSRKDRHQLIGQGAMGMEMMGDILNDPRLEAIPFYLETPVNDEREYKAEIEVCHDLLK